MEILEALRGRVASPSELARELDRSLGVIAYHANTLVRCGCLQLVETKPRRGTVEHFFAVTPGVDTRRWLSQLETPDRRVDPAS